MMQYNLDEIREKVKEMQSGKRFEHTIGVMYTAASLAMRYNADVDKALLAGLLHDVAKGYTPQEMLELCEKYGLSVSGAEKKNPGLLHAKLGAYIAEREYAIKDSEILDAITWHTTGRPNMTLLDKIIYIADYIEPNRKDAPNLDIMRYRAFNDLDDCLIQVLESILQYLQSKNEVVDPMTEKTYLYYKNEFQK